MKALNNWIIIAGNGRNTGKTTLACRIIASAKAAGVTGIKISPHPHTRSPNDEIIVKTSSGCIIREKNISMKDSSRMLQAGASQVFYVECDENNLPAMLSHLERLTSDGPVVCESGAMRNFVKPALFIMTLSEKYSTKPGIREKIAVADIITGLDTIRKDENYPGIHFLNNEWKQTHATI